MGRLFHFSHLVALALTLAVEGAGMALVGAAARRTRRFARRCLVVALAVNVVSHTAFWMSFPWMVGQGLGLWSAEGLVTMVEAAAYWRWCPLPWWRALLASALLNLASLVAGTEVWRFLPSPR